MEDSADALEKSAIECFSNAVVLRGVMGGKATFGAFLLKKLGELVAGEFTATVRAECLDLHPMLSVCPGCKGLVSFEGLVLSAQDVDDSVASGVVCECDVVAAATQAVDWRGAPQVGVDFVTEVFGKRSFALLENDFASHLCVFA